MQVRTRFAPSPTGFMHLGNLRSALYGYLFARKNRGTFILRIEDTDQVRFVPGAMEVIFDTLRDCGMTWDEGPDVGGDYGPYIQSQRKALYLPYAQQLVASGHAYYCFCTKEEIEERRKAAEARGEVFKYDKHCLHLSPEEVQAKLDAGVPYVIRLNAPTTGGHIIRKWKDHPERDAHADEAGRLRRVGRRRRHPVGHKGNRQKRTGNKRCRELRFHWRDWQWRDEGVFCLR